AVGDVFTPCADPFPSSPCPAFFQFTRAGPEAPAVRFPAMGVAGQAAAGLASVAHARMSRAYPPAAAHSPLDPPDRHVRQQPGDCDVERSSVSAMPAKPAAQHSPAGAHRLAMRWRSDVAWCLHRPARIALLLAVPLVAACGASTGPRGAGDVAGERRLIEAPDGVR